MLRLFFLLLTLGLVPVALGRAEPVQVELGKALYFDPRLSKDGSVSCNSCHNLLSPSGPAAQLPGQKRDAPTLWNVAQHSVYNWDGSAATLEEQAKSHLAHLAVIDGIQKLPRYLEQFKAAFPKDKDPVNLANVAAALVSFERTLVTGDSPFDLYKKGNKKALSAGALRGMKLVDEVGCTACHTGPHFAGEGLKPGEGNFQAFPLFPGSKYDTQYDLLSDKGRMEVTKNKSDANLWRVPTWRNVAVTAPYFHNGKVATLDEAVRVMAKTQLDQDLTDAQVSDIVEFLNALTGKFPKITVGP